MVLQRKEFQTKQYRGMGSLIDILVLISTMKSFCFCAKSAFYKDFLILRAAFFSKDNNKMDCFFFFSKPI